VTNSVCYHYIYIVIVFSLYTSMIIEILIYGLSVFSAANVNESCDIGLITTISILANSKSMVYVQHVHIMQNYVYSFIRELPYVFKRIFALFDSFCGWKATDGQIFTFGFWTNFPSYEVTGDNAIWKFISKVNVSLPTLCYLRSQSHFRRVPFCCKE